MHIHSPVVVTFSVFSPAHGETAIQISSISLAIALGVEPRDVPAVVDILWAGRIQVAAGTLLVDLSGTLTYLDGTQDAFRPRSLDAVDIAVEASRLVEQSILARKAVLR